MHCLVFTDTDLYSLTKGKSYLAKQKWRRSTCLRDQCYDVGCHPCNRCIIESCPRVFHIFYIPTNKGTKQEKKLVNFQNRPFRTHWFKGKLDNTHTVQPAALMTGC